MQCAMMGLKSRASVASAVLVALVKPLANEDSGLDCRSDNIGMMMHNLILTRVTEIPAIQVLGVGQILRAIIRV